ncbi:hypothetical protein QYZ88_001985 [Lachnospiraceae bacterium C1.1]|nr:hypothetical protein [Lachnospiraceae bacterium C1.1]
MRRKKALSLLLAFAMVFTTNIAAFADDVVTTESTVEVESTQSPNALQSMNDLTDQVSYNRTVSGGYVEYKAGVYYENTKPTPDDLDIYLHLDNSSSQYNGCYVPVKTIKITSSNKKKAGQITFKVRSIKGASYIVSSNNFYGWRDAASKEKVEEENVYVGDREDVTSAGLSKKQAKAAYKELKSYLKSVKGTEMTTTIVPRTIFTAIDKSLLPKKNKKISYECYEDGSVNASMSNDVKTAEGLKHTIAVQLSGSKVKAYYITATDVNESIRLQNGTTIKAAPAEKNTFYDGYVGKYKIGYTQIKNKYVDYNSSTGVITINDDNYAVSANLVVSKTK